LGILYLIIDTQIRILRKFTAASPRTENAPAGIDLTIPVGTGKTTVECYLIYLAAEGLF
jgi:hypothetical protein